MGLRNFIRRLDTLRLKLSHQSKSPVATQSAVVIPAAQHGIKPEAIPSYVLQTVFRFKSAGYQAYLVGGSVRDLLFGQPPKDFDLVTDARPEQIKKLFRNCRIIGRRFRLVHIYFHHRILEVSTFRAIPKVTAKTYCKKQGLLLSDNEYGNIEQDAQRRDFTLNALYYDVEQQTVLDFVDGLSDLSHGILKVIGDPWVRYREDPVRMLRAIRFSAKLQIQIESRSHAALIAQGKLLNGVSAARLFDEIKKLFLTGVAGPAFMLLKEYAVLEKIFPVIAEALAQDFNEQAERFLTISLREIDQKVINKQPIAASFLFAVLFWPVVLLELRQNANKPIDQAFFKQLLTEQNKITTIPKWIREDIVAILQLQKQLEKLSKRPEHRWASFLKHDYFAAALELLELRAMADNHDILLQKLKKQWDKSYRRYQAACPTKHKNNK